MPISVILGTAPRTKSFIEIHIADEMLRIFYRGQHIWQETLKQPMSNFGVESCSDIAKIIFLIDNNNEAWKNLVYIENLKNGTQ